MRVILQERGTNRFTIYPYVHTVKTLVNGDIIISIDADTPLKLIDTEKFKVTITG